MIALTCEGGLPTIVRLGSCVIRIYAEDHNPPHFHVTHVDFQVLIRIDDLGILAERGRIDRRVVRGALAWAEENKDQLRAVWDELNG